MKTMTCGGIADLTCDAKISGNSPEEMAKNCRDHIRSVTDEAHQEIVKKIDASTDEDTQKWMVGFKPKFDAAPEA